MGITSIGVSALTAYRQALDTTGHNIANVNTDGYSRQRVDFTAREPTYTRMGYLGNGVESSQIQRQYDTFLASQMRSSQSVTSELQAYYDGANQIDQLVADPDVGIQPAMQNFFNALQGLADNPNDPSSRQLVLSEAASMADRFRYFDQQFEDTRNRANEQIGYNVTEINRLAQGIADINASLNASATGSANDLLDKRDQLVNQLSGLVNVQVLQQSDGAYNIFIGKGQPLVMAGSAATLTTQPSSLDPQQLDIAIDYSYGAQVITDQMSGGTLGGLLRFKSEILDPAQNRIGLVALGIADDLNAQHQLGLDQDGLAGGALFAMGSPQVMSPSGTGTSVTVGYNDVGQLTGSDYQLTYDGTDFILKNLTGGDTQTLTAGLNTVDGLDITIDATGAIAGDTVLIRPTRNASSSLDLLVSDTRRLAAASPLQAMPAVDANGSPLNSGSATITQPANSSVTGLPLTGAGIQLVYNDLGGAASGFEVYYPGSVPGVDPADDFIAYDNTNAATVAGTQVDATQFAAYGGISFTLSGIPADGDTFIIGNNANGSSDNRNALLLAGRQNADNLMGGTATFDETYAQMVSSVGSKTHYAEQNLAAQESLLSNAQESMAQVSGVNLDEEAAKLVQYQQAYQASAQVISVASTLFDTLLSAVRR
jgi:flagellar hook-associated protein 1